MYKRQKVNEGEQNVLALTQKVAEILKGKQIDGEDFRLAKKGKVFPLFLPFLFLVSGLSKVVNFPLIGTINWFVESKLKDNHWWASIRFVMCMFGYPIFILILLGILCLIWDWGVAITILFGLGTLSFWGQKCSDKLSFWKKRKEIENKVGSFSAFEIKIKSIANEIAALVC